jgi:hypothetical protein
MNITLFVFNPEQSKKQKLPQANRFVILYLNTATPDLAQPLALHAGLDLRNPF